MVELYEAEREAILNKVSQSLGALRTRLHLSQARFSELCGISRTSIIQIESGAATLSWGQMTSVLFVCLCHPRTKEFLFVNRIPGVRFLQYLQRLEENIPPRETLTVHEAIMDRYFADFSPHTRHEKVLLSKEEKLNYAERLRRALPDLRRVMLMSQAELAAFAGMSRARLIALEKQQIRLTWSQLTSILLVATVNERGKEFLFANHVMPVRFWQFIKLLTADEKPELCRSVPKALLMTYDEILCAQELAKLRYQS